MIALLMQKNPGAYIGPSQTCMTEGFCKTTSRVLPVTRLTFTCSKSTVESPEKGVKYVQSEQ